MRLQVEPSEILVELDGVECRVWNGVTESLEQVFLFVRLVATREELTGLYGAQLTKDLKVIKQ
jgi:hypothetical protein